MESFITKVEELCCSCGYWDIQASTAESLPTEGVVGLLRGKGIKHVTIQKS